MIGSCWKKFVRTLFQSFPMKVPTAAYMIAGKKVQMTVSVPNLQLPFLVSKETFVKRLLKSSVNNFKTHLKCT